MNAESRARRGPFAALTLLVALAICCGREPAGIAPGDFEPDPLGHTRPTEHTRRANAAFAERLALDDTADFEAADRGLVAREEDLVIRDEAGNVVWDMRQYAFLEGDPPASVNPSLWRQAQLNNRHGLYRVAPGIHQVRGYDLANMTLIDGESGWIVVDTLTSEESARAALAFAREQLGERPVSAVILTHSHIDHFGGIGAVVTPADAARGVRIVAPLHMVEEATSENVLAGLAMGRRATFMYGFPLGRDPRGHVDSGLGKAPLSATFTIMPPTDVIDRTGQELVLDGVRFVFQYAPESEAPAELTFYLPERKALCSAEVVTHTMHNLYTLRGAKVRDALKWAGYIDEMIGLFGDAEVMFASHHWPTWGNSVIREQLAKQRDTYKFIHDQTLRLANEGLTPREIAETLVLPESLASNFAGRGYYGTVRHNAKAVYQRYFGWYDGNPAHLDPLPPAEAGRRYVDALGGRDALLATARDAFGRGEYRWSATLLDHLVFAEPDDAEAAEWLARSYDQLGYQAESAPWRDIYLTGAYELRHGASAPAIDLAAASGLLRHLPIPRFFDAIAARLDGQKAADANLRIGFVFDDVGESYLIEVTHGVLNHRPLEPGEEADATIHLTRELWLRLVTRQAGIREMLFSDDLQLEGGKLALLEFFSLLSTPAGAFEIVRP